MFPKAEKLRVTNERKYKRLKADYLIKHKPAGTEGEPTVSNIKDVSTGGVKFWTEHYYPVSMLVQVSLLVPPIDRALQILGRVVRVRRGRWNSLYYAGVAFLEIPAADQELLNAFVERIAGVPGARPLVDHAEWVERELLSNHA